jgi:N-acetylneuraminic acid mutarotase
MSQIQWRALVAMLIPCLLLAVSWQTKSALATAEMQNISGIRAGDGTVLSASSAMWSQKTTSGMPGARCDQAMAYDSQQQKVILFGGISGSSFLGDTWVFDPGTNAWINQNPGSAPRAREGHAVYDSRAQRMVLFGGWDASICRNDTWVYDTATNSWTKCSIVTNPPTRRRHALAYDSLADKTILFGGDYPPDHYNDTWAYDYTANTWTNRTPTISPTARKGHAMAYDSTNQRLILFGGTDSSGALFGETWVYHYADNTWTNRTPTICGTPPARKGHAMAYDSLNQKVVLFGGDTGTGTYFRDTWTYDFLANTWHELAPTASPLARTAHAMVFDSANQKMILFGGYLHTTLFNDTWFLRLSNPSLQLSAPTGGEDWLVGTATQITWTSTDLAGTVTAEVKYGSSDWTFLATSTATHGGPCTWTPSVRGSTQVRITGSDGDRSVTSTSGLFNLRTPTLTITAPTGGENWLVGTATQITWTSTDLTDPVTVQFSRDSGSWETLSTGSPTQGPYSWTPTGPGTASAQVRLIGGGYQVNVIQESEPFFLLDPALQLTAFTGGERWGIGATRQITYTCTDLTGTVALALSRDLGATWVALITTATGGTGSSTFPWTVTGPGTINAKIRTTGDGLSSTSAAFVIAEEKGGYCGTFTATFSDGQVVVQGNSSTTGTLWVTPLDRSLTMDPPLSPFLLGGTGQRSAFFWDISQRGLTGTLTITLHYPPALGAESFRLFRWNGSAWVDQPGTLDPIQHTFTFAIDAGLLGGTPFALAGDPHAMPGLGPWAIILLVGSLLATGVCVLRRWLRHPRDSAGI